MGNSPDFLVIPHQIIIDKNIRPLDRIVYGVVYWYAKMKEGRCFASNETLAGHCGPGTAERSVRESLSRLETAGYVRRIFDAPRSRSEIVPLVVFGVVGATAPTGRSHSSGGVGATAPQSSNTLIVKPKDTSASAGGGSNPDEEKAIGEVIKAFEPLTTLVPELYKRKPQREASRRLIAAFGKAEVVAAVSELSRRKSEQFAPLVDSPLELERKWAKIQRFRGKATNQKTLQGFL